MNYTDFLKGAASVKPSARQLAFLQEPFYAFVHFSPNTYTGLEWGDGTEDPAIFNPVELDCDQWVQAIKAAGMTGMVLTAKHHDGFCLWPSRYTEHSVKNSPWKGGRGDVVREASEACRRGGIRFGVYLSPWDRNCKLYGTPEYNGYYKAQLTELLTQYGELFYVWFDGACGEGPNGRKQEYDFQGYIELIRKYQPNACIFNVGPDMRWVGNESGTARLNEWMVVPQELCYLADKQTDGPLREGSLEGISNTWPELGGLSVIQYSRGLCFCPAETDMSIRPGWFYHPEEEPHSLERLQRTYLTSVGGSATFNLNIPPMPNGRFDDRDVQRLKELGDWLKESFGQAIPAAVKRISRGHFQAALDQKQAVRYVELREDIQHGQRVELFQIKSGDEILVHGTTIGSRRICALPAGTDLSQITVRILAARDEVPTLDIRLYGEKQKESSKNT